MADPASSAVDANFERRKHATDIRLPEKPRVAKETAVLFQPLSSSRSCRFSHSLSLLELFQSLWS